MQQCSERRGVIAWQGRMLIYGLEHERLTARFLGEQSLVPVDTDLRAAIEADLRHQQNKASPAD